MRARRGGEIAAKCCESTPLRLWSPPCLPCCPARASSLRGTTDASIKRPLAPAPRGSRRCAGMAARRRPGYRSRTCACSTPVPPYLPGRPPRARPPRPGTPTPLTRAAARRSPPKACLATRGRWSFRTCLATRGRQEGRGQAGLRRRVGKLRLGLGGRLGRLRLGLRGRLGRLRLGLRGRVVVRRSLARRSWRSLGPQAARSRARRLRTPVVRSRARCLRTPVVRSQARLPRTAFVCSQARLRRRRAAPLRTPRVSEGARRLRPPRPTHRFRLLPRRTRRRA
jgi:hypothetical protein